jgi:hypothetical protein
MKEVRKANVMFNKNGQGFVTTRIALPVPFVKELGISEKNREVIIYLDYNKIVIEKGEKIMEKRFEMFLKKNVKNKNFDLEAYIDDLTSQWCNTGILEYELSSSESIDGTPHTFAYSLEELQELGYGIPEED